MEVHQAATSLGEQLMHAEVDQIESNKELKKCLDSMHTKLIQEEAE